MICSAGRFVSLIRKSLSHAKDRRIPMNHKIRIAILMVLIGSPLVSCKRAPSYSVITDDLIFNKDNNTYGKIELIRVDPNGAVVLKHHDKKKPMTVRSSGYTTLSIGVKAVVIAADAELQTTTIRVRMSNEPTDR
jgi:hypothetical protein